MIRRRGAGLLAPMCLLALLAIFTPSVTAGPTPATMRPDQEDPGDCGRKHCSTNGKCVDDTVKESDIRCSCFEPNVGLRCNYARGTFNGWTIAILIGILVGVFILSYIVRHSLLREVPEMERDTGMGVHTGANVPRQQAAVPNLMNGSMNPIPNTGPI